MSKTIKIKSPWLINPFLYYSLFWAITILLYYISPSKLNIPLDTRLLIFLVFTILVSLFFGIDFNNNFKNKSFIFKHKKQKYNIIAILAILYICEFIYSKNIPLISSLQGSSSGYDSFGIPTIHVIVVTFSTIYSIKNLCEFLLFKDRNNLIISLIILLYYLLVFSRGMLITVGFSMSLLVISQKEIKLKHVLVTLIVGLIGSWLFGILGNLRVSNSWNNSSIILSMARIDIDSNNILAPMYWVEEYIICSLRNLNTTIIHIEPAYDVKVFAYTLLPDFISKRIFGKINIYTYRLVNAFTTGSTYEDVYYACGFIGMIFEFLIYMIIGKILLSLKYKNNIYKLSVFSYASIIFGLSIFTTIQYSGYSFALIWGVLLGVFEIKCVNGEIKLTYLKHAQ